MRKLVGATAVALGAVTSTASLSAPRAGELGPVALEVTGCADADAVRAAARVELAGAEPAVDRVAVVCLGASRVLVVAFQRGVDRPVAREVAIDDVAVASRARAVAIVIAELVRNVTGPVPAAAGPGVVPSVPSPPSSTVGPPPHPPITPLGQPTVVLVSPPPLPAAAPAAGSRAWTVGASLHQRAFTTSGTLTVGPRVEVDTPLHALRLRGSAYAPALRLRGSAHLAMSDEDRSVGSATITSWTAAASLLARTESTSLTFDAGPLLEIGAATAAGTPATGLALASTTTTAPLLLAGGQVVLGARLARLLVPHVAVDAGGVVAGITADVDGERVLAVAGVFLGVRLGLALGPGD